ncbi:MAG TPA: hypothetical protein VN461_09185 [Vicinamibacteria bacterium]|nr:hypothetical protein [Vicinamibacteria bacterium]
MSPEQGRPRSRFLGAVHLAGPARSALLAAATILVLLAIATDAIPLLRGPAPYPPEWQWAYRESPGSGRLLPALAAAAGLLGLLALSGSAWARRGPRRAALLLLPAAAALGWLFQLGLLDLEPAGALPTLLARTVSRTHTSYYTVAVSPEARDPWELLRRYASLLPTFRSAAKHAATHPPGPVLYYRGLVALCEASPPLTALLLRSLPEDREPKAPAARAAALLGALLLGLLGAATGLPVAWLAARLAGDTLAGVRVGVLWSLLPGPALFVPQFDQALTLPVTLAAALLIGALGADTLARALLPALTAGLLGGIALFLSYGSGAFLLLGGLAALALDRYPRWRGLLLCGLAASTALGLLALSAMVGYEPLRAAATALAIHREVYTRPRSYALWLLFNPLDLALFLGVPVTLLGLSRLRSALGGPPAGPAGAGGRLTLAMAGGLSLLVLSGVTRGEVGRIWMPLMPLLLVSALARPAGVDGETAGPGRSLALLLGLLLAALCITMRVFWAL